MTRSGDETVVRGARFVFDGHEIVASARIPAERTLVRMTSPDATRPRYFVRDDAVLVLRADRATTVHVEALFAPVYAENLRGRRLLLDATGGFGVYPTRPGGSDAPGPFVYELRADDELWISILPPRERSPLRWSQAIAHEGRPRAPHPPTVILEDAAQHCRVLALHAYFWAPGPRRVDLRAGRYALRHRPWTTARHVPADPDAFARVKEDCRRLGMRLVVYLSPRYCTAPELFEEMARVLDEYGVDGLYLDGVSDDFRITDAVIRRTRAILGPDRILYLNTSDEPFGTPRVHCPFIDAQADFVLRGDSGRGGLPLDRFLRYAVSGWNVSNAVGMWCHYGSSGRVVPVDRAPPGRHIDAAFANHVRLWRRSVWGAKRLAAFDARYYAAIGN